MILTLNTMWKPFFIALSCVLVGSVSALFCYKCSESRANQACTRLQLSGDKLTSCAGEVTQCYTHLNASGTGVLVSRGCGAGPECDRHRSLQQKKCSQVCSEGHGCNRDQVKFCVVCDSRKDWDCERPNWKTRTVYCPSGQCYVRQITDTITIRGCVNVEEHAFDRVRCEEGKLNGSVICHGQRTSLDASSTGQEPAIAEEQYCYRCNSHQTRSCNESSTNSRTEQTRCASGTCYMYWDKASRLFYRDCLRVNGTGTNLSKSCLDNPKYCVQCQGAGCNNQPMQRDPIGKCIGCNDTAKCMWQQDRDSPRVMCKDRVFFFDKTESCFSKIHDEGVLRGCLNDKPESCANETKSCKYCDGDNCNTGTYQTQFCIKCPSARYPNCLSVSKHRRGEKCASNATYNNRGCYTAREANGTVTRGCHSDYQGSLHPSNTRYALCYGTNCNTNYLRDTGMITSSKIMFLFGGMVLLFTIVTVLFYTNRDKHMRRSNVEILIH